MTWPQPELQQSTTSLASWGWDEHFRKHFEDLCAPTPEIQPGRVLRMSRDQCEAITACGVVSARLAGRLVKGARDSANPLSKLVGVGDWVAVRQPSVGDLAQIVDVLPRKTVMVRQAAGRRTEQQIIGANVDTVFVVSAAVGDLSPRRLERYRAFVKQSGADLVFVLNKIDLVDDIAPLQSAIAAVAGGAPVVPVSAAASIGLEVLRSALTTGSTVALVGSSGVGKSSLTNVLAGASASMAVRETRSRDLRGVHTTSHRELVSAEGGGSILDTPGLRELSIWADSEGIVEVFEEIQDVAAGCRFRDCQHQGEPGCAVSDAVERGDLAAERLTSRAKLQREEQRFRARHDAKSRHEQRKDAKQFAKLIKERTRNKPNR